MFAYQNIIILNLYQNYNYNYDNYFMKSLLDLTVFLWLSRMEFTNYYQKNCIFSNFLVYFHRRK